MNRTVALIVFYTKEGKILLQERKARSKAGEEWGFFGGGVEKGETFEQALVREAKEELGIELKHFRRIGQDVLEHTGCEKSIVHVDSMFFITPFERYAGKFHQKEGGGMKLFTISEAKRLTLFSKEQPEDPFLNTIQQYINNIEKAEEL